MFIFEHEISSLSEQIDHLCYDFDHYGYLDSYDDAEYDGMRWKSHANIERIKNDLIYFQGTETEKMLKEMKDNSNSDQVEKLLQEINTYKTILGWR